MEVSFIHTAASGEAVKGKLSHKKNDKNQACFHPAVIISLMPSEMGHNWPLWEVCDVTKSTDRDCFLERFILLDYYDYRKILKRSQPFTSRSYF